MRKFYSSRIIVRAAEQHLVLVAALPLPHSPRYHDPGYAFEEATMAQAALDQPDCWPALPLSSWKDTYATLHMWTQIVGKVRLALTPMVNHWWNVPLYVSARGLTTSSIPYRERAFELYFDFVAHQLVLQTS